MHNSPSLWCFAHTPLGQYPVDVHTHVARFSEAEALCSENVFNRGRPDPKGEAAEGSVGCLRQKGHTWAGLICLLVVCESPQTMVVPGNWGDVREMEQHSQSRPTYRETLFRPNDVYDT